MRTILSLLALPFLMVPALAQNDAEVVQAAVEAGSEAMAEGDDMVIAGERNLLSVTDLPVFTIQSLS